MKHFVANVRTIINIKGESSVMINTQMSHSNCRSIEDICHCQGFVSCLECDES